MDWRLRPPSHCSGLTSSTAVLLGLWLLVLMPTLSPRARELITPAGGLPLLIGLVTLFGSLWSDVSWVERISGLKNFLRLLARRI